MFAVEASVVWAVVDGVTLIVKKEEKLNLTLAE
jgi:hypothetical protein